MEPESKPEPLSEESDDGLRHFQTTDHKDQFEKFVEAEEAALDPEEQAFYQGATQNDDDVFSAEPEELV